MIGGISGEFREGSRIRNPVTTGGAGMPIIAILYTLHHFLRFFRKNCVILFCFGNTIIIFAITFSLLLKYNNQRVRYQLCSHLKMKILQIFRIWTFRHLQRSCLQSNYQKTTPLTMTEIEKNKMPMVPEQPISHAPSPSVSQQASTIFEQPSTSILISSNSPPAAV